MNRRRKIQLGTVTEAMTRRRFVKVIAASGLTLAAACVQAPTAPSPASSTASSSTPSKPAAAAATAVPSGPVSGGRFVMVVNSDPTGFDPGQDITGAAENILQCMEGLVRLKEVPFDDVKTGATLGGVEPALAESWTISEDKLTFTFNLRKNVKFHDGADFNADAVITAFDRLINQENPYYFKGKMRGGSAYPALLASYRAVDPMTVEMKLKQPSAVFLYTLSQGDSGIPSPTALQQYGPDVSKHPTGTGPWKFVDWVPNDHWTFERNPSWWGGKTYFDQLTFRPVSEAAVQRAMLERGEADLIDTLQAEDVDPVKQNPKFDSISLPSGVNALAMNCSKPPFNDVRVRQAMNYAVNTAEMHATLYKGYGTLATSPLVPIAFGYDASLKPYPYDIAKAKQLLSEAGYANGFEARLVAYNTFMQFNPIGGAALSQAIQDYLSRVGVRVNVQVLEEQAWNANWQKGDFELSLCGWGSQPEPDNVLFRKFHSSQIGRNNNAWINDPKLDGLIVGGQQEYDTTKRAQIYKELQTYIHDIAPWIYLNSPVYVLPYQKSIRGLHLVSNSNRKFWRAWRAF
jgi:peptide/nickel transport system substrate-binding protein